MTCDEFQNRLSAYLDGELSRWTRWKIQTHLRYCEECDALVRDLSEVDNCLLTATSSFETPEYVTDAVMRRLPAMPPAWRPRAVRLSWAAGLAVAVLQVFGFYGAYRWGFFQGSARGGAQPSSAGIVSPPAGAPVVPVNNEPPRPVFGPGPFAKPYPNGSYENLTAPDVPTHLPENAAAPRRKPGASALPGRNRALQWSGSPR